MRTRMLMGTLFCGALSVSGALAQTWNGDSVGSDAWTDGNNWVSDSAPANNGTATPNFAGNKRLTPSVNTSYDVNGITFDNQASAFNIISVGSSVLTLRGAGVTNNNSGVTQTISVATNLGAAQTWGGAGGLNIGGPVALNSNTLTIDTPAIVAFIGIMSGTGSVVKNGSGAGVLSGNSIFTGGVTLNAGTLAIGANNGLGTGALTINGGKIEGTGGNRVVGNSIVINNDFAIPSGTGVTFSGPVTLTGQRKLTNSITNLAISGTIGESVADGELTIEGGTLALSGSALTLGTSLRQNSGTLTATGLITTLGNTLTQSGGTFTGSLINRGSFVYNGGTHSGNIANDASGDATFNANFTFTAAVNNLGTLRVANGRTVALGAQQLNNSGTLELQGGTVSANASTLFTSSGSINGHGTVSTTNTGISNSGQINVSGGNLTLASNVSVNNSGIINVPNTRQLLWNSTTPFNNTGLIQLNGGGVAGNGDYSNLPGGEIRGSGTVTSTITNSGGLIRATGPLPLTIVDLSGNNTGSGEMRVDNGATMNVQSHFLSSGTIVLGGADATLNLNSVTITGTLRGQGRVTGVVQNGSVVRAEGGTLTLAGASSTNTAAGRLEAGVGAQLLYTQGLTSNGGIIALTGGAYDNNGKSLANPGRIEGYGIVRTGGLTNSGSIAVSGTLDVLGPVTNSGSVSTSAGSTTRFFGPVTGAGTFTGSGTVTFLNTFAPGASPAAVSFGGDLELGGGSSLGIEIGGNSPGSQYDTVSAAGSVSIGGGIDVDLLGDFTPTPGSSFQIVSGAQGIDGAFDTASFPSVPGVGWQLKYTNNSVLLNVAIAGDYNFDGQVDAADYSLWRDSFGQIGGGLAADGNGNGQIDEADYGVWKSNYGNTLGGSGGVAAPQVVGVPEPSCGALLVMAIAGCCFGARRWSLL